MTGIIRIMKLSSFVTLALVTVLCSISYGAKYAGDPFHLGVGGRALGMGGAFSAICDDATSGFWNPAGLTGTKHGQFAFMHSETFGSLLNHDYIAFAAPLGSPDNAAYGGITLTRLGGGGIKLTEWDYNLNRPVVVKESGHADYQLLVSYSTARYDRLSLGVSAKFIYRDIADNSAYGLGADIGAQYRISSSITAGLMVRDATTTLLSYDTGTDESIYPTLIPGIGASRQFGDFLLTAAIDADLKFENYRDAAQYWMGSISADSRFGFEVGYLDAVFGRIGSDVGRLTLGAGVSLSKISIDIAFMQEKDIDDSFRISLLYSMK